ncbi:MAG: FAD-binding protein [Coriobacteriia bacterium]|nr:FAD-binding protein [Coriobacteriia bacterium]MBS5477511.1 FAD-binding protein [Coriobacteriia bacterium]
MSTEMSRRSFIAAAGVTAAASVAAAGLAAAPSQASALDALTSETPDWLGTAPEIAESDITETVDTEVLICGFATGGVPCALSAAQAGNKVLVIDRDGQDNVQSMREDLGAMNSKLQQASFAEFPEFEFSEKDAVEDIVRYANGFCNYDLIKMWAQRSGEAIDWVAETIEATGKYVMEFEGGIGNQDGEGRDRAYATGHSPQPTDQAGEEDSYTAVMRQAAIDAGAEVRWSTPLIKLEADESGKVTGAIAQDTTDGHYVRINASKGVVLATGGYSTSTEMMQALQPEILDGRILCTSGSTDDGSGIKAGMWLGARKDPIGTSILFNRCCVTPEETAGNGVVGRWFWFGEQPFLKVNLNGERFCNESGPYDYMLHSAWGQPQHTYVDIWDSGAKEKAEQMNEVGCCRLFPFDNGAKNNIPFDVVWNNMNQGLIDDGYIQVADTIEELAEKLNIPAENLTATVEKYNGYCDAGEDPDYFKESYRLTKLDQPPFYGVRTGSWHLATFDGLLINTHMQVLNQDNEPIEGLYAIGDCSGGFFCVSYPNLFTGLACGRTTTEAYILGQELGEK